MFTQGKWAIQRDGDNNLLYIYSADTTQWICEMRRFRSSVVPPSEIFRREANAKLIAAAPQLLEACAAFVEAHEKSHQLEKTDVALRLAKAGIEKATK